MKHKRLIALLFAILVLSEPVAHVLAPRPSPAGETLTYLFTEDGYQIVADHDGPLYHVRNGERRTTGQPMRYSHTLWLFGNSATFGFHVPDDDTIASRLQVLVPGWRVVNRGIDGQYARGELLWLKHTPLRPGDIIIFLDGTMDALNLNRYARPVAPWIWEECAKPEYEHLSIVVMRALCTAAPFMPLDKAVIVAGAADYRQTITEAERYAIGRGTAFYHFIQPGTLEFYPEIGPSLAAGTPALRVPAETFIDSNSHVNRRGAESVARQIYDWITVF